MRARRLVLLAVGVLLGAGLVAGALTAAGLAQTTGQRSAPAPAGGAVVATDGDAPAPSPSPSRSVAGSPAPSASADPPDPVPTLADEPTAHPDLARRLSQALGAPDAEVDGVLGVAVIDDQGRTVLDFNADLLAMPASTQKLVTAAAALRSLGPDFRYRTEVRATAAVSDDGAVDGDLVLVGSGDPTLGSPTFAAVEPDRPRTPMEALADRVVEAGVRRVAGGVLGDATVFADEPAAPGWLERYFAQFDATKVSGLTVDAGRKLLERDGVLIAEVADAPAEEAAAALLVQLEERGVVIDGGVGVVTRADLASEPVASITSAPLSELTRWMVQHSDNHVADAVFRTVGAAAGDPTWKGSEAAALAALEPLQLDWTGARLADGSGLSRDDRLGARQLANLQQLMQQSADAALWDGLLAVSGESGTLRKRYRGTVAEHRLRGKTGALTDARSLAGTVVGPEGERLHFAIVASGLSPESVTVARRLQDVVVLALAEHLYGCVRLPVVQATPPPTPQPTPPYALECAA